MTELMLESAQLIQRSCAPASARFVDGCFRFRPTERDSNSLTADSAPNSAFRQTESVNEDGYVGGVEAKLAACTFENVQF